MKTKSRDEECEELAYATRANRAAYGIFRAPENCQVSSTVKKTILIFLATFAFAGCASTADLNSLEARVSAMESEADSASTAANAASAAATKAGQDAAAAQSAAQRAMDAANSANQRAERIAETCCSRK